MSILQTLMQTISPKAPEPTPPQGGTGIQNTPPENNPPAPPAPEYTPVDPLEFLTQLQNQKAPEPEKLPEFQSLPAEEVLKQVQGIDFSKVVDAETMQAIQAGGEGAIAALLKAVNSMTRMSMAQSIITAQQLAKQSFETATQRTDKTVPSLLRSAMATNAISGDDSLANPIIQNLANNFRQQFETQFPAATSAQIAEAVKEALKSVGTHIVKQTSPATPASAAKMDWADFAER